MRARHTSSRHYHEYQMYMTVPNAAIQAQNLEGFLYLLLVTNMEKLTQPQMVLSLRAYGEEAPKTWTRVQLMARLKELEAQGEVTAPTTKKMKTPLEEAVKELNRAAARKATLQKYVQEGCGLTITGNETISVLQQKAMTHLLATVEASAKDPLGFGKYSTQSYEHEDQRSSLLRVGHPDGEGGPVLGLPEALCEVVGDSQASGSQGDGQDQDRHWRDCGAGQAGGLPQGRHGQDDHPYDGEAGDDAANDDPGGRHLLERPGSHDPAAGVGGLQLGPGSPSLEGRQGSAPSQSDGPARCGDEAGCGPGREMSMVASQAIACKADRVVPNMFEELVGRDRPRLMEVLCDSGSILSETFVARTQQSECAIQCGLWNGHDLAKPEGLKLVLEQIYSLRPKHVWVSLPNQAFSSLQNLNQRSQAQKLDLKAKRALAIRVYESTVEIAETCVQLGVHVSVELSERSEAWRLPSLQKLRFQMGLRTTVVKGCAVGLRGMDNQLMLKGWRVVTSHARLAEQLNKPCRCVPKYEHARCEGANARSSQRYTKEFAKLVYEALEIEGGFQEVVQECTGVDRLPEGFGLGLMCTCSEDSRVGFCGQCAVAEREAEQEIEQPKACMTQTQAKDLEQAARNLLQASRPPDLKQLQNLLDQHPFQNSGKSRRNQATSSDYRVFGTYAYGNHYGNTNRTRTLPELCRVINKVLKQHLPPDMVWTSFALNHGTTMPIHRDVNNAPQYPNGSIGFGSYSGGELWIEEGGSLGQVQGRTSERLNGLGQVLQGREVNIKGQAVVFSPTAWHGTCEWEGERWVLTVFVSRGWDHISVGDQAELRKLGFPVPQRKPPEAQQAMAVDTGPSGTPDRRKQDERIRKQLYLLHCATGHSTVRHMVQALKRRGADPRTLELAEAFTCPVCQERKRPPPRNLASLEPLPPKLYTIEADIGNWVHPVSEESVNFMLIIDEGSRFRTARVLTTGAKQAPNAQACLHYLQEGWVQYFGHPRCLRLDPAGAFRSAAVEEWCDKHSIYLDVIPGEAHWKVGAVESAVRGVKDVMTKLCSYDEELTPQQALAEAIVTFNHKELVRGYSPAQHVLGQAPDETGRFIPHGRDAHPALLMENPSGEFERSTKLRAEAEKALTDWTTQQRLLRAKHSRHRPCYDYSPGELVYYWRTQDSNKGRRQPGGKHGRFLGPARVLATETRRDDKGSAKPGGSIWLVKGRSLLKCVPEQLRRATQREELLESLADAGQQRLSWTFHSVADAIGGTRYEDISGELPSASEWNRAQQPEEEQQPVRHRLRRKQAPGPSGEGRHPMEEEEVFPPELMEPASAERQRSRSRGREGSSGVLFSKNPSAWWSTVKEEQWPDRAAAYWQDQSSAVEIEIPMPDSQRGRDRAWRDLGTYFVGSLKRRAVELSERKMTPDEREAFRGAKAVEVKNFVASKAFELLPEGLRPDRSQAIGMRWILTWKLKEDGSRKPKARAVLLGYQDEAYEHRATTSPVMTRQTRQLLLQLTAWKRWKVQKGDVTGAFLQSRQYPDTLFCIPCPEICHALGVPEGSITRVRKACYGLVDAPLEWYRSVDTFLQGLGFSKLWSDPCCWVLRVDGILKGAISGHVDDFLFCGKQGDALWESKLQAIREHFKWGDWEEGRFTQCGVVVEQKPEGFELSQPSYLENLQEIGVNATRRKDLAQPTTDREKTQLRALLGGISWHAQQVAPFLSAEVSLLLTEVSRSSVDTILKANMLLATAKAKQAYKMKIHAFEETDDLVMIMWVDAANGNRIEGGSTQGLFLGMAPKSILGGHVTGVSPIAWHSQKIDRACRSPGAAEAQAAVNGEDCLYYGRYGWSELLHGSGDLRNPDLLVSETCGCLVTDSRNVYDRLITEVLVVKGAEKRTSLELLSIKESQARTKVQLRWVHSEAQLANSLTKQGGSREYELYYKMGHQWRLVEDESMMSAKRRREKGIQPLEQKDQSEVTSRVSKVESLE